MTPGSFNHSSVYGIRSLEPGKDPIPLEVDTPLAIASCTKLLTTIACLQLVERGLTTLDADVASILPELAALPILTGFDASERPITTPRTRPITLRHLLTHSSGLSYDAFNPTLIRWCAATGKRLDSANAVSLATVETRFSSPLLYEPGTSWGYSCGIDWAGKLAERVSGTDLETYFQCEIFAKVGVAPGAASFWLKDRYPEQAAKGAALTIRGNGQDLHSKDPVRQMSLQDMWPGVKDCMGGQGLRATMPAYLAVLKSLLADDEKLLSIKTRATMFEPQLSAESKKALNGMRTTAPEQFAGFVGRLPAGVELDWGLGGILSMDDDDKIEGGGWGRRKGTLMWSGLFNLFWFVDRTADLCGIFGTQVIPPGDLAVEDLIVLFEKNMYEMRRAAKGVETPSRL